MHDCALTSLGVAELADNFVSAEAVFDLSVPCWPCAPFYVLASRTGWSVCPSAITHVHTPLISQHPPTPSICATCLASFPLCCSPPQSCDCYCVVPATQKLAWPNLNQCYWSCSCFISQHKGCAPHFRGSRNEWLIGGVLCKAALSPSPDCQLSCSTVLQAPLSCNSHAGCLESGGRKRGEWDSAAIAACQANKAEHGRLQRTGEKAGWGRVPLFRKGRCWW